MQIEEMLEELLKKAKADMALRQIMSCFLQVWKVCKN